MEKKMKTLSMDGILSEQLARPRLKPAQSERRSTFIIPDGHEAVRGADGRATGEVRPLEDHTLAAATSPWRDMASAPKGGKHCILAIYTGCFVYSIQGAFMNGKWMNAADIKAEPLAWMPNILLPHEFCPWTDEYKAKAAASTTEAA
jgi:hypothetical protein